MRREVRVDLFDPSRHEPLTDAPWNADYARDVIRAIADGLVAAADAEGRFPWHPLDAEVAPASGEGADGLYMGAAGCWWALRHLGELGLVAPTDTGPVLHGLMRRHLGASPPEDRVASWLIGASGVVAAAHAARPDPEALRTLESLIAGNREHPTWEMLWGSPGTLEAARLFGLRAPFEDAATRLLAELRSFGAFHGWQQDLYGARRVLIGAGHGLFGNLHPLLEGLRWLTGAQRSRVLDLAEQAVGALASRHQGRVNWTAELAHAPKLIQWCHGAPGVITSLRSFPVHRSPRVEALLVAGGELIWDAGPLKKGPGLCHGTAGNGFAFLVLHRRTGDPRWLARARAFAMHAVRQWDDHRARYGVGRWTLWTGDPGLACYLAACVRDDDRWPTLDVF